MTIISIVTVQPKPDAAPDDVQKLLGKAADLARKAGAENVTAVTTVIGGSVTGTGMAISSLARAIFFLQVALASSP